MPAPRAAEYDLYLDESGSFVETQGGPGRRPAPESSPVSSRACWSVAGN